MESYVKIWFFKYVTWEILGRSKISEAVAVSALSRRAPGETRSRAIGRNGPGDAISFQWDGSLPMTDPVVWQIDADPKLFFFVDGTWYWDDDWGYPVMTQETIIYP